VREGRGGGGCDYYVKDMTEKVHDGVCACCMFFG
jgi:hypothetical protein